MKRPWQRFVILLAMMLMAGRAVAQVACPALVKEALHSVSTACGAVNRNQACYGNLSLHATLQHSAPSFTFDSVGDILDVMQIRALKLDALDEARGIWGMAMMRLQADIPESLPGQNITFLLFGDVEIENTATDDQAPMQAFYLRSGMGDSACLEAPESGVLIQTPHGVQSVNFHINGVDVEIGSTVMLQAQPDGLFVIRTLEGAAVVTLNGRAYPVIAGTQISLSMSDDLQPIGLPSLPVPLLDVELGALPLSLLPRAIPPAASLSQTSMIALQARLDSGLAPCGVPDLPACEHALTPHEERIWANQSVNTNIANTSSVEPSASGSGSDTAGQTMSDPDRSITTASESTAVPTASQNQVLSNPGHDPSASSESTVAPVIPQEPVVSDPVHPVDAATEVPPVPTTPAQEVVDTSLLPSLDEIVQPVLTAVPVDLSPVVAVTENSVTVNVPIIGSSVNVCLPSLGLLGRSSC